MDQDGNCSRSPQVAVTDVPVTSSSVLNVQTTSVTSIDKRPFLDASHSNVTEVTYNAEKTIDDNVVSDSSMPCKNSSVVSMDHGYATCNANGLEGSALPEIEGFSRSDLEYNQRPSTSSDSNFCISPTTSLPSTFPIFENLAVDQANDAQTVITECIPDSLANSSGEGQLQPSDNSQSDSHEIVDTSTEGSESSKENVTPDVLKPEPFQELSEQKPMKRKRGRKKKTGPKVELVERTNEEVKFPTTAPQKEYFECICGEKDEVYGASTKVFCALQSL